MGMELAPLLYSDAVSDSYARRDAFIQDLLRDLTTFRCARIRGLPHVTSGLLLKAMNQNSLLHQLPADILQALEPMMPDGSHKYNGHGMHLIGCERDLNGELAGHRSYWLTERAHPIGHPYHPHYFEDLPHWPDASLLPEFAQVQYAMMWMLGDVFANTMSLICAGLDYDYGQYAKTILHTGIDLRSIRSVRNDAGVSLTGHKDNTKLTIMTGSDCDGLMVQTRSDEWVPVKAAWDDTVIMIGDALELSLCGQLKATRHRVSLHETGRDHRHNITAFFFGSGDCRLPIVGDKAQSQLLNDNPDYEFYSSLDICDLLWRDYVGSHMSGITFMPQKREKFYQ